jgi:hypothetical protein
MGSSVLRVLSIQIMFQTPAPNDVIQRDPPQRDRPFGARAVRRGPSSFLTAADLRIRRRRESLWGVASQVGRCRGRIRHGGGRRRLLNLVTGFSGLAYTGLVPEGNAIDRMTIPVEIAADWMNVLILS